MDEQDCMVGCDCEETVYLNEITNNGSVYKFSLNPDGSLSDIGNPWFSNSLSGESLTSPHGLGTDLNGNVYIGETSSGDIRRFSCDGEIVPTSEYELPYDDIVQNIFSIDNILYTNSLGGPSAFDLCDGTPLGQLCLNDASGSPLDSRLNTWGFSYNSTTEMVYISSRLRLDNFPSACLLYTSPSPRDRQKSRMPSSA